MNNKLFIQPQPYVPVKPQDKPAAQGGEQPGKSFADALEAALQAQNEIKFSAHALERIRQRNLNLNGEDIGKISAAVEQARQKGISSSLVMLRDVALVAGIKSKTIVTAMQVSGQNHVITGIDGAVMIN